VRESDFRPKTSLEQAIYAKTKFRTIVEKEADYFKDYEVYKENRREMQDRNRMYFVLE